MIKFFAECLVPEVRCNFRCEYCYVRANPSAFSGNEKFNYSVPWMLKALDPKRFGGGGISHFAERERLL